MTLTVTALASYPFGEVPRVQLTVASTSGVAPGDLMWPADSPYPNGGLVATSEPVTIYRVHPDGNRYKVLTDQGRLNGGLIAAVDYHAPFNQLVSYVAVTAGEQSDPSPEAFVLPADSWHNRPPQAWLIHATDQSLSVPIDRIVSYDSITRATRAAQFQIVGLRAAINLTSSPLGGQSGKLVISCDSKQRLADTVALFADNGPILINTPFDANDIGWIWVQPGDVSVENAGEILAYPYRRINFEYQETVQPDTSIYVAWNCKAVAEAWPTCASVTAAYNKIIDLTLDRRA